MAKEEKEEGEEEKEVAKEVTKSRCKVNLNTIGGLRAGLKVTLYICM